MNVFSFILIISSNSISNNGHTLKFQREFLNKTHKLKNIAQIEHSRHRSVTGFTVNLMAGLAAYSFFPKKPMIAVDRVEPEENGHMQLSLF
jgi:hypothetical protein